jgi:hypothetical protein
MLGSPHAQSSAQVIIPALPTTRLATAKASAIGSRKSKTCTSGSRWYEANLGYDPFPVAQSRHPATAAARQPAGRHC